MSPPPPPLALTWRHLPPTCPTLLLLLPPSTPHQHTHTHTLLPPLSRAPPYYAASSSLPTRTHTHTHTPQYRALQRAVSWDVEAYNVISCANANNWAELTDPLTKAPLSPLAKDVAILPSTPAFLISSTASTLSPPAQWGWRTGRASPPPDTHTPHPCLLTRGDRAPRGPNAHSHPNQTTSSNFMHA
jgi:hypothetical protein